MQQGTCLPAVGWPPPCLDPHAGCLGMVPRRMPLTLPASFPSGRYIAQRWYVQKQASQGEEAPGKACCMKTHAC